MKDSTSKNRINPIYLPYFNTISGLSQICACLTSLNNIQGCPKKRKPGRSLIIFFKNPLGTFLSQMHILSKCQISEKSNERISRKAVANGQTDGRTNGRTRAKFKVLSNSSTNEQVRGARSLD